MKLASYLLGGKPAFGIVTDMGVITLSDRLGGRCATLRDALADDDALDDMMKLAEGAEPDAGFDAIEYLPVITNPNKIICVGLNYRAHAAEHGHAVDKPNIFTKFTDTLSAHEGEMWRPKASQQFDFEGELAVIIGKSGRAIKPENALSHIAGYTCYCDGSVRDFIKASLKPARAMDGDGGRDSRSVEAHADDAAERPADAAFRHRHDDVRRADADGLLLGVHRADAGRRHRHRHTRRHRRPSQSAGLDESRRRAGSGNLEDRHAPRPRRGREVGA